MANNSESFNKELYDLLKVRGYKPVPLDSNNQRIPASQAADVFEFTFSKDGEDYGKVWVTIDNSQNVIVYYDEEQQESPDTTTPGLEYDDTWTGLLKHLKNWAQRRQLSFELANKDRLGDDMRQRDYYKMKERLGESTESTQKKRCGKCGENTIINTKKGWRCEKCDSPDTKQVDESYHPMGKKASYNDAVPNVKIVLQHNRSLEEGEARFRNVARIYLENVDGERFLAPTTRPGIARVYARHIAEGGVPNDERWNHIKSLCEDYNKMAGFVRATKNNQFNESAMQLVNEGINYYNNLRETLHKLTGHKGYNNYFESYTPPLMENDGEDLSEMFMSSSMDPRIENAMPILSRIHKPVNEMAEVDSLAEWADGIINEKLELDEAEIDEDVMDTIKKGIKSLKRGVAGWEKGMHDVDTVKAATKSLSPDQKEKAVAAKVGKGSPAELQQKLIKREKNKKVDESADLGLGAFLKQYPEAQDAMRNAVRHFEYAYDAMDHVAGHVLHKMPYKEWEKVRPAIIAYFEKHGLKADANDDVNEATGYYSEKHPQHDRMTKDGYEHSEQDIQGKKMHRYYKPGSLTDLYKYDDEEVKEDLGPEQKRVGQLGPTEKVKNNNIGKLVGANESKEIDPELARIIEMAKFKR